MIEGYTHEIMRPADGAAGPEAVTIWFHLHLGGEQLFPHLTAKQQVV